MSVEPPLRWLLAQLPAYVPPDALDALMERYAANKVAYAHQCKMRHAARMVALIERRGYEHEALALTKWRSKLEKLREGELSDA